MSEEKVQVGRDRYLADNSLDLRSYSATDFPVYFWKWAVRLQNPGLLPYHDLHHVVTGYGTGLVGEAEISAYELRAGCRSVMVFILCIGAILGGMFVAPRRIWLAWKRAGGTRTLYHTTVPYDALLEMSVGDLRQQLGMPREGYP
jgi:hypothetical protein